MGGLQPNDPLWCGGDGKPILAYYAGLSLVRGELIAQVRNAGAVPRHAVNPLEFWLVNLTPQYLKFQNSRASKLGPLRLGHFCRSSRSGGRIVNDDPRVTAQRCKGLGFCSKHLY